MAIALCPGGDPQHRARVRSAGAEAFPVILYPREHLGFLWLPCGEAAEKVFSWTNAAALEKLPEIEEAMEDQAVGEGDGETRLNRLQIFVSYVFYLDNKQ